MLGRNKELHDSMIASGHEFIRKDGKEYFTLNGEYVGFPIGYIRGTYMMQGPESRPYQIMVNGPHGWIPQNHETPSQCEKWAIEKQSEILGRK